MSEEGAGSPAAARKDGTREARRRVGLVLASLHTGASVEVWPAVAREAAAKDVDLFCFPGGRIGLRAGHEASRNEVYELAARAPLDGLLVWSSSLSGVAGAMEVDRFIDRYRDLPLVSLSTGVSGLPLVSIDYYGGMRAAVLHLLEAHGYRGIAFLRGPAEHPGSEERWRAFLDLLEERGIDSPPALASSPFAWDRGRDAILELIDQRELVPGRDFRALVAASDLMALEAVKTLEARGYRIPEDVAVVGMNDSVESRLATPALTTVRGPFAELGEAGLRRLLAAIDGDGIPDLSTLEATLVVRQSCGCPSRSAVLAAEGALEGGGEGCPDTARGEGELLEDIRVELGLSAELAAEWIGPLVEAWDSVLAGGKEGVFLDFLGRAVDRSTRAGEEVDSWQGALSLLRRKALCGPGGKGLARMEGLVGRARVLVAEAATRAAVLRSWEEERRAEELRSLDHELLMAFEPGSLGAALRARLPSLGIGSAWICSYLDGGRAEGEARLVVGYRDGEIIEGDGAVFPAERLVPAGLFPDRRLAYVVEPLFFHESQLGYALFEIGPTAGALYEELRDSIGGALRSFLLLSRLEEARHRAELADEAKTTLVSNVTHELRAPVDRMLRGIDLLLARNPGEENGRELLAMRKGAEQQARLVNDLLDLSRAELDELDLDRSLVDLGTLARSAFEDFAPRGGGGPVWSLDLPARLPLVFADPSRITQVLANLLVNAAKFTKEGEIRLSASVEAPWLRLEVADTGRGIPASRLARIFEPFVSAGPGGGEKAGVGLGLAISRHIAELHGGSLEAASEEGRGATFSLRLPLPDLAEGAQARPARLPGGVAIDEPGAEPTETLPCLLLVAEPGPVDPDIAAAAERLGLPLHRLSQAEMEKGALDALAPRAIAFDLGRSGPAERAAFRRIRQRPGLRPLPFLLFGGPTSGGGRASFLEKGSTARSIADAILLSPSEPGEAPFLIADDDPEARAALRAMLERLHPGEPISEAADGEDAWSLACEARPRLAILDVAMPGLSGLDLAERFRADPRFLSLPLILLTSRVIGFEDARRVEGYSRILFGNRSVWTEEDFGAGICRLEGEGDLLPSPTSAFVKRAVAWMNEHYRGSITRWKLAEAVNVSEDYLSRIFRKELGITPWEYLTRLRVVRAKDLLRAGGSSVASVGELVGFPDQAYFSRVFRKVTGLSPQGWRDSGR
jgi:signal transduction histidine kinase/DNA-binding LacI/PurR family transcriptional regulator/AraC-like DNA-binding protein/CheY-like chemotaxis protein